MDDLLIRGGHVLDGTGAPGRDADVAVQGGRISAIEAESGRTARRVIDARGHVVAPGFIDIHTHSDFTLPVNPRAESKIRQGVTLEVTGNCGFSVAPVLHGKAEMLREYLAASAPWLPFVETSFATYADAFPATSLNVILQVGHNTLRLMTAGMDNRRLTRDELATMEDLLEEALVAGAWGLSSGLFTVPGNFADADEIHGLAQVLRRHGAAYSSHIRDEAAGVFEAVREAIAVAQTAGVHVQIAHLKLSGADGWGGAHACSVRSRPRDGAGWRSTATRIPMTRRRIRSVICSRAGSSRAGSARCSSVCAGTTCARESATRLRRAG